MDSFEMSVQIGRAVEEVFSFISDLGNDPSWRREWVDAKRDWQEPIDLGTTTVLYGQALVRRIEAVYEVSEYVPNRTVQWKTVTGPLPLTFWRSVDGAGPGTRVTMGYSADFRGVLRFLRPLLTSAGKRSLSKDLPTLKKLLEASS